MNPPKRILVATDFSAPSDAAVEYAINLAQALGASVHVVHAFELPFIGFPDGNLTVSAEMASRIIDAAQGALTRVATKYGSRGPTLTSSLEQGPPRETILDAAKKHEADLVVLGTHGRHGVGRALIGSVAERIVRTATIPVLTVHAPAAS